MKYKYVLQFLDKKLGKTFIISEKRNTWLSAEGFATLLKRGHDQGGQYLKSWRT